MTTAYEELVRVLYPKKDREAIEWAIGSALQLGPRKTVVIYGAPSTGKTTMIAIIQKIFEGTTIVGTLDDIRSLEHWDDPMFVVFNSTSIFGETESIPDTILVSTSGRVHTPSRYFQLVNAIYEDPDEIPIIAQQCAKRFRDLGPTYYDHNIPTHIPEENA